MLSAHLSRVARSVIPRSRCWNQSGQPSFSKLMVCFRAPLSLPAQAASEESVRLFGSKRNYKRKKRSKIASGANAKDTKTIIQEKKEKIALLKKELEEGYEYPIIEERLEKGPESWAVTMIGQRIRFTSFLWWVYKRVVIKNGADSTRLLEKLVEKEKKKNEHIYSINYKGEIVQEVDEMRLQPFLALLSKEDQISAVDAYIQIVSGRPFSATQDVEGDSNLPTIVPSVDRLFGIPLTKTTARWVKRGQFVSFVRLNKPMLASTPSVYRYGCNSGVTKRISALGGDIVEFHGKRYKVPEDHCWVLGDNPKNSFDSRYYGAVPLQNLRQLVLFAFTPSGIKWLIDEKL